MRNVILFNLFIWLFILNCSDDEKKVNGGCYVENGVKLMSTVAAMNLTQAQRNLPLCYQFSGDKTVNKSNCIAMSGKEMDECPSVGKKHTCDGKEKGVKIVLYEGWPGCGTLEGKSDSSQAQKEAKACYIDDYKKLEGEMELTSPLEGKMTACFEFKEGKFDSTGCKESGKEMAKCPEENKKHTCPFPGDEVLERVFLYDGWPEDGCKLL